MRRVSVGSSSMTAARAGDSQRDGRTRAGENNLAPSCAQRHTIKRIDACFTGARVPRCQERQRGGERGKTRRKSEADRKTEFLRHS